MQPEVLVASALINNTLVAIQNSFLAICALAHLDSHHKKAEGVAAQCDSGDDEDAAAAAAANPVGQQKVAPEGPPKAKGKRKGELVGRSANKRKKAGKGHSEPADVVAQEGEQRSEASVAAAAAAAPVGAARDEGPLWDPHLLDSLGVTAAPQAAEGGGAVRMDRRPWTAEEVMHLVSLVEDAEYRKQHLGIDAADFRVIGEHFRRSDQAARSKYYYWTKVERHLPEGPRVREKALRRSISYGWMAVYGLGQLPGMEGTGGQILEAIEAHPPFQHLLDKSVRLDSAGVVRWKQRVREELSHRHCFINTGRKVGGEAVWRLNLADDQNLPSKKIPKDLMPFLGRHGRSNG